MRMSVWSVLSISCGELQLDQHILQENQTDQIDQTDEMNQIDQMMMTGNLAAAWGARLAAADYIPAFPITPQTEIVEALAKWCESGAMAARFVTMDSEHSMMTAAGAAAATGARVFTATSSQGLLYAIEVLYSISGWRAPLVLVNVSRALAAPITLEPDHNDVLAARDSGFLQIHAETCQEVLDSILMEIGRAHV